MNKGLPTDPKSLKELKRACSELTALISRLQMAMKNRSLEQADKYALFTLIEKYARRLEKLERNKKLLGKASGARISKPMNVSQREKNTASRKKSKKKPKVKSKKSKVPYPKTKIQVEHAAKIKQLHQVSGLKSIRASFVSGGSTGLKK